MADRLADTGSVHIWAGIICRQARPMKMVLEKKGGESDCARRLGMPEFSCTPQARHCRRPALSPCHESASLLPPAVCLPCLYALLHASFRQRCCTAACPCARRSRQNSSEARVFMVRTSGAAPSSRPATACCQFALFFVRYDIQRGERALGVM